MSDLPYKIINANCKEAMRELPENSVDAIVTDPPYGLEFMGKEWDKLTRNLMNAESEADKERLEEYGDSYKGRRSKLPDYSNVGTYGQEMEAWHLEWAKEALRVLKPGGHLLAFSGSRTYHRMACAIEDAGFEVRDQIMWVYGSGFPKSHNVANSIDKKFGCPDRGRAIPTASTHLPSGKYAEEKLTSNKVEEYKARTEHGKPWEGWGTALKPAHEPIIVARKPLDGTVADNVLKWGVGGLNVDACRVETNPAVDDPRLGGKGTWSSENMAKNVYGKFEGKEVGSSELGRWPANFIHDGDQQVLDLFPETGSNYRKSKANGKSSIWGSGEAGSATSPDDSGSAARFFYCPKASKADKEEGLDDFELKTAGVANDSGRGYKTKCATCGGYIARSDGVKPCTCENPVEEYYRPERRNTHPTVKPTELMRYLIRLVTPKGGLVLDPFNGSGSTGKAAMLEGCRYIGIELDGDYIKIAEARIRAALEKSK